MNVKELLELRESLIKGNAELEALVGKDQLVSWYESDEDWEDIAQNVCDSEDFIVTDYDLRTQDDGSLKGTVTCEYKGKELITPWMQGSGLGEEVHAFNVLYSLLMDWSGPYSEGSVDAYLESIY